MNHPLTSEMVQSIWDQVRNEKSGGFTQDDLMRTAYDRGVQACVDWLLDYPETGMFPPAPEWLGEKMEKELLAHNENNS